MAKLKAVLDSLDGLPDGHAEFYAEGDNGKYYLDVDDIASHSATQGLVGTMEKLKRTLKATKDKLDRYSAFEDLDEEQMAKLIARADSGDLDDGDGGDDDKVQRLRATLEAQYNREKAKLEARAQALTGALERKTVDAALDAAIAEAGFTGAKAKAVKAMLKQEHRPMMQEVEGADGPEFQGVFQIDANGVPESSQPIKEFVEAWKGTDVAAEFLPPSGRSGAGTQHGRGGTGGGGQTLSRSDPLAWAENAEKIAKGEVQMSG